MLRLAKWAGSGVGVARRARGGQSHSNEARYFAAFGIGDGIDRVLYMYPALEDSWERMA